MFESTLSELLFSQVNDDICRIYSITQKDNIDFNYTCIPSDFKSQAKERFDSVYMKELFNLGFLEASHGYKWENRPPEFRAD